VLDDIAIHAGIPDADHVQDDVVETEKLLVVPAADLRQRMFIAVRLRE